MNDLHTELKILTAKAADQLALVNNPGTPPKLREEAEKEHVRLLDEINNRLDESIKQNLG